MAIEIDMEDKAESLGSPRNSNNPLVFVNHILHCSSVHTGSDRYLSLSLLLFLMILYSIPAQLMSIVSKSPNTLLIVP